jgi:hypothetical protein
VPSDRVSPELSKEFGNPLAAVALHAAHYNFFRKHATLTMTRAMAAKTTGELWSLDRQIGKMAD